MKTKIKRMFVVWESDVSTLAEYPAKLAGCMLGSAMRIACGLEPDYSDIPQELKGVCIPIIVRMAETANGYDKNSEKKRKEHADRMKLFRARTCAHVQGDMKGNDTCAHVQGDMKGNEVNGNEVTGSEASLHPSISSIKKICRLIGAPEDFGDYFFKEIEARGWMRRTVQGKETITDDNLEQVLRNWWAQEKKINSRANNQASVGCSLASRMPKSNALFGADEE